MTDEKTARRNIFVLTTAQALGAASPPIIISLGGLVGKQLSSDPALVTLPVSLFNLGLAMGTLPAAYIMRTIGRKHGYLLGAGFGISSGLIAAFGISSTSFFIFCLGTFIAGFYAAYVQSYRFAAADGVEGPLKSKAISWVMIGGLIAAIIGPQVVIWTRDAFPETPYAGSFLSQAGLALLAVPVLLMLRMPRPAKSKGAGKDIDTGRLLKEILLQPRYVLAVAAGVVSYGLMAFVMTAAPMAIVGYGYSDADAALGIQWHVLAMFAPSFVTGSLMARFGKEQVTAAGLLLIALSAVVALAGLGLWNFWISLILLGVGWNFGFIGATALVTDCHSEAERGKAQGANDFVIFGTVAAASFFAGSLLHASGWQLINWLIFPLVAAILIPLVLSVRRKSRAVAA